MAKAKICVVAGCGKKHFCKTYCDKHYRRFVRNGNPLGGRTGHGEPDRFIHDVALKHTGVECLLWPFSVRAVDGRAQVRVDGAMCLASRYICEVAHGAPPTERHEAAHSCGRGHLGCISPRHLSWKTHTENERDKVGHGTHNRGERQGSAKLTNEQVWQIRSLGWAATHVELADRYGVSPTTISNIQNRKSWKHI